MTAPLVAVLVIAVGLPLLAWWSPGGPTGRGCARAPSRTDGGTWSRRHELSTEEPTRIAADVPRGLRLPDPRLRRAAVDRARQLLEQEQVRFAAEPQNPWAADHARHLLDDRGPRAPGLPRRLRPTEDVNWVTVAFGAVAWGVRRRRALRRTIELDDEPTPADGA